MSLIILAYMLSVVNYFNNTIITYNTEFIFDSPCKILMIVDWKSTIIRILENSLFFNFVEQNSTVFVNIIKNNTDSLIPTNKITEILIQYLQEKNTNKKINIINIEQLHSAYRTLEIFPENHRNSYNCSVKIAKYLQAEYVLYGIVYGTSNNLNIELQLILVKTGEIIYVICSID